MNYESLSNEELERWAFASPNDPAAASEMLRRAPIAISDAYDEVLWAEEEIKGLEQRIDQEERLHTETQQMLDKRDEENDDLSARIEELEKQIADTGIDLV